MFRQQYEEINKDLERTNKAIIAIGCSFVQGQGTINDELYEKFKWNYLGPGASLQPIIDNKKKKFLLKKYPSLKKDLDNEINFTFMEYDNAFVNVLCKKYLKDYTPVNFGLRGCGNRGSIKELYFHPHINWHKIKESIVIYVPSGLERFDFINDTSRDHFRWTCMWPHYENVPSKTARRLLWEGYNKQLYSDKFEILEQIAHVQELITWCKANNSKLIVTPGFDRRYDREYFNYVLGKHLNRDNEVLTEQKIKFKSHQDSQLLDLFPWDKMFKPNGFSTFMDMAMDQEDLENKKDYYLQFLDNRSPNGWITPCSHPGQKAHDLFAKLLAKHIKELK